MSQRNLNESTAEAEMALGNEFFDKEDFQNAFLHYKTAADLGSQEAYCQLGLMYRYGQGVPKNEDQAMRIFMESIANDFAPASQLLAEMYIEKGNNFFDQEEFKAAWENYEEAMEIHPDPIILGRLGDMYANGIGVTADQDKAKECFSHAMQLGNTEVIFKCASVCLEDSKELKKSRKTKKLAEQNLDVAIDKFYLILDLEDLKYKPAAAYQLATILFEQKKLDEAAALFRFVVNLQEYFDKPLDIVLEAKSDLRSLFAQTQLTRFQGWFLADPAPSKCKPGIIFHTTLGLIGDVIDKKQVDAFAKLAMNKPNEFDALFRNEFSINPVKTMLPPEIWAQVEKRNLESLEKFFVLLHATLIQKPLLPLPLIRLVFDYSLSQSMDQLRSAHVAALR